MEPFIVAWALISALILGGASHELQKAAKEKAEQEALYRHIEIYSYMNDGLFVSDSIKENIKEHKRLQNEAKDRILEDMYERR